MGSKVETEKTVHSGIKDSSPEELIEVSGGTHVCRGIPPETYKVESRTETHMRFLQKDQLPPPPQVAIGRPTMYAVKFQKGENLYLYTKEELLAFATFLLENLSPPPKDTLVSLLKQIASS